MNRTVLTSTCAAALALALTLPAPAVPTPEKAVGKDTMVLVWVDLEQIDAEVIRAAGLALAGLSDNPVLQQQGAALPLGEMQEGVEELTAFREGFIDAGGRGMLLSLGMPAEQSWSPPMSLLAKTTADADPEAIAGLLSGLGEEDEQVDAELVKLDEGWHDISMVSPEGEVVTTALPAPDAAAFKAFTKQFDAADKPAISVAFRMQDKLREMIEPPQDPGQAQDPQAAMMMGMLKPLKQMDTLGVSVSMVGEGDVEVDIRMAFLDANSANQFKNQYNAQIMFVPAMLAGAMQDVEGAPTPKEVNDFFMKLQMQGDGDMLSIKLDQAFFDLAEKFAPLMDQQPGPGGDPLIQ